MPRGDSEEISQIQFLAVDEDREFRETIALMEIERIFEFEIIGDEIVGSLVCLVRYVEFRC